MIKRKANSGSFLPAVDLWNPSIQTALVNGSLRLQRGQWVICGDRQRKSRYVGVGPSGVIHCVHPQGKGIGGAVVVSRERFSQCCDLWGGMCR